MHFVTKANAGAAHFTEKAHGIVREQSLDLVQSALDLILHELGSSISDLASQYKHGFEIRRDNNHVFAPYSAGEIGKTLILRAPNPSELIIKNTGKMNQS
jgi:hypothetical protein